MLALRNREMDNESAEAPSLLHIATTIVGYVLGMLLAAIYVSPIIGLVALALYLIA